MMTDAATRDVVDELHAHVDGWPDVDWVAGRVTDDAVVAVVRRSGADALEGHRVLVDTASLEEPAGRTAAVLDAALDLLQGDGPAVPLPQAWAEGLVPDPAEVLWCGAAVVQSAHESLALLHSSVQGCGGAPL